MAQTRAAIHCFANHCSKLNPSVIKGDQSLGRKLKFRPNPWQNTAQFLYRTATILEVENTVFLVPVTNDRGDTVGAFPVLPSRCEIVSANDGTLYLRYRFRTGDVGAVEYDRCGVLTKMQYDDDFFGAANGALDTTMDLINVQNQGIINGIKQAAAIRFMAKLGSSERDEVLEKEKKKFAEMNLGIENNGGVMMFDQKYAEVKQIDSRPFVVDASQMDLINKNVWTYYGANEKILCNDFDENTLDAYYEAKVEPFAIQLSLAMTYMIFKPKQIAMGIELLWSANRLTFASTKTKAQIINAFFDRGIFNRDECREILQYPPLPNGEGQDYYMRGEYKPRDGQQTVGGDDGNGEEE